MSPLAASATVVNLILATGPFSYPYGFTNLGPIISLPLLLITAILSYMTATYVLEVVSLSCASNRKYRTETLFGVETYKSPEIMHKMNHKDNDIKKSPYYIRQKIELGSMSDDHC